MSEVRGHTTTTSEPVEREYMTQAATARFLGCGRNRVRALIKAGQIPYQLDPETGKPMISRTALMAYHDELGRITARGAA